MNAADQLQRDYPAGDMQQQDTGGHHATVRVKELSERDRRRLLMHFLDLPDSDRLLRFGNVLPDALVTRYVQRLDFVRDTVFGVFDADLKLIGVGHLAFVPCDTKPILTVVTEKERVAEFGLSVSASARGLGLGTRLFERAAIHCRNEDVDALYMHCLSSNQTMIHIASKAGMVIHNAGGESDAYLKLSPASPGSMLQEAMEQQVAVLDYSIRANTRAAAKWLSALPAHLPHFKDGQN